MNKYQRSALLVLVLTNLLYIVLLVVFIVLKLTSVIDWSWVVVLVPLWVFLGQFMLFTLLGIAVTLSSIRKPHRALDGEEEEGKE